MTSPQITKTTRIREPVTFYVYYNVWDGEIIHVSNELIADSDSSYIATDSKLATDILRNDRNRHDFTVGLNDDNVLELMEKTNNSCSTPR